MIKKILNVLAITVFSSAVIAADNQSLGMSKSLIKSDVKPHYFPPSKSVLGGENIEKELNINDKIELIISGIDTNIENKDLVDILGKILLIKNIDSDFKEIKRNKIDLITAKNKSGDVFHFNENVDYFILGGVQYDRVDDVILQSNIIKEVLSNKLIVENILVENQKSFAKFSAKEGASIDETIYVFADYRCPYCKSLFNDIDMINKLGVNVYFVPFLNAGLNDRMGVKTARKILCSKNMADDTMEAMKNPKSYGENITASEVDCPESYNVLKILKIADQFNVEGTPTTVLSNGYSFSGYNGVRDYVKSLALGVLEGNKINQNGIE